jgi:hypothetical protein
MMGVSGVIIMSLVSLFQKLDCHPVAEAKRPGFDFDVSEILAGLEAQGYSVDKSSLYRQLRGMAITKNERGYYSAPQVAVVLGWYVRGGSFGSYSQYIAAVGQGIYDQFAKDYQEVAA